MSRLVLLAALVFAIGCSKPREVALAEFEQLKADSRKASALAEAKRDVEVETARLTKEFDEIQETSPEQAELGRRYLQEALTDPYKGNDLRKHQQMRDALQGKTAAQFIADYGRQAARMAGTSVRDL